jgi:hypothetical protein
MKINLCLTRARVIRVELILSRTYHLLLLLVDLGIHLDNFLRITHKGVEISSERSKWVKKEHIEILVAMKSQITLFAEHRLIH